MFNTAPYNSRPYGTLGGDVPAESGTASLQTKVVVVNTLEFARLHTRVEVGDEGLARLPTKVNVVVNVPGKATLQTHVRVYDEGIARLSTAVHVYSAFQTTLWSARVVIDGIDWSAALVGELSVDAEEGAARIASLTIRPPDGLIDPVQWTARSVTIDLLRIVDGVGYPSRVFTGVVEVGSYDPNTRLFALDCTDDLQLTVAKMDRPAIDNLTGAVYSEAVMGEIDDNWEYAQALMETREASLDKSRFGVLRVTPWQGLPLWATYGNGDLLDLSLDVSMLRRSEIVNEVHIDSQYRYSVCRQRGDRLAWSQLNSRSYGFQKMGMVRPTISECIAALSGGSWHYMWGKFFGASYDISIFSSCAIKAEGVDFGGSLGTWWHVIASDAVSTFYATVGLRYAQTVTEYADIVVKAPQSIASNGTLPKSFTVAAESTWNAGSWESWDDPGLYENYDEETGKGSGLILDTCPGRATTGTWFSEDTEPLASSAGIGLFEVEYAPDMPRSSMEDAQLVAIAKAKVMIIASHRKAMVGASIDCRPEIDLSLRIAVNTDTIVADGKVARVAHTLDIARGTAITEFKLAISGVGAVGSATPDPLTPPEAVATGIPEDTWTLPHLGNCIPGTCAYSDTLSGLVINPPDTIPFVKIGTGCVNQGAMQVEVQEPNGEPFPFSGFRVVFPGVEDTHRNAVVARGGAQYSIEIPIDPLTQIV